MLARILHCASLTHSCWGLPTPDIQLHSAVFAAGPQAQVQAHPSHSRMRACQSASSPRHVHTSERASVGEVSAATPAGTAQQRTDSSRPTLLSPFATCEVQDSQAQLEEIKPVSSRKRSRCQSADLDITPLTKLAQVSSRQQQKHALTAGALPIQHIVTLHKPTPQRPNASTPCCFGVASATQPLQHSHFKSTTARPSAAQPAASTAVPSSLPTAMLANAATVAKSTVSEPSDEDRASPSRREHSQECKHCQGQSIWAFSFALHQLEDCNAIVLPTLVFGLTSPYCYCHSFCHSLLCTHVLHLGAQV